MLWISILSSFWIPSIGFAEEQLLKELVLKVAVSRDGNPAEMYQITWRAVVTPRKWQTGHTAKPLKVFEDPGYLLDTRRCHLEFTGKVLRTIHFCHAQYGCRFRVEDGSIFDRPSHVLFDKNASYTGKKVTQRLHPEHCGLTSIDKRYKSILGEVTEATKSAFGTKVPPDQQKIMEEFQRLGEVQVVDVKNASEQGTAQ